MMAWVLSNYLFTLFSIFLFALDFIDVSKNFFGFVCMQTFIYALFVFCVWYADSSDLPLEELLNKDVSSVDSVLSSLDNDEVSYLEIVLSTLKVNSICMVLEKTISFA